MSQEQDFNARMRDRYYRPAGDARGGGGREAIIDRLRQMNSGIINPPIRRGARRAFNWNAAIREAGRRRRLNRRN